LKNAGASEEQITAYKSGDASAISGLDLSAKEIESLEGFTDTILENQESLEELNETVRDSLMETFNAWHDKMESVGARFDTLGSIVGNFQNIIDTVGAGILGISEQQRQDMEKMTLDAANGRLATNKKKLEFTQNSLTTVNNTVAEMESKGIKTKKDENGTEQTLEWWKQQQATLNEQLLTDQEAFTSSWADALQTAADIF
jgi:chromosome segregation ATPase